MTQLSPEAAALLEAARRSHGPSESDRERVLSSLHASLGIALPLALASSVAEAATEAAAQLPAASVVESGAQLASTAEGAAHVIGQGALKLGGKGALQLGTKLLTWKMGKVLLATVALGGAVGVGISQAPRKVEQDSVEVRTTRALVRPAARDAHSESVNPASSTGATTEPVAAEPEPREPERNRVTAVAELQQPRAQALAATPAVEDSSALASAGSERAPGARKVATDGSERKHGARVGGRRGASHRHSSFRARAHRERPSAPSSAHSQSAEPQPMLAVAPLAAASAEAPPAAPVPLEVELIRKAMTSLRDHDAGRALALLEEHAARYPSGAFATERRGLHAVALCAAGRVSEGKSEQASFLRTDSAAPIAARVRRACGEPIE